MICFAFNNLYDNHVKLRYFILVSFNIVPNKYVKLYNYLKKKLLFRSTFDKIYYYLMIRMSLFKQ